MRWHWPAQIVPLPVLTALSPALIALFPLNKYLNKVAANVHNDVVGNLPFCSIALFWTVSLMPFINKPDSSSYLTIFMI